MIPLLVNPYSGSGQTMRRVEALAQALRDRHGLTCSIITSLAQRQALLADPGLPDRCPCVGVAGGDGTIASILNEIPPSARGRLPVAVIAAGNENLLARELGLRTTTPDTLAAAIAQGRSRPLQLGIAGDRLFTLMVSAGLDSQVVRRVEAWRARPDGGLKRARRISYLKPILTATLAYDYPPVALIPDDGEPILGTHALVFNVNRYAGGLGFAPEATGQSGRLHYVVFERPGIGQAVRYLTLTALSRHARAGDVRLGSATRLTLTAPRPLPVQADGDTIAHTPIAISLHASTARFITA